MQLLISLQSLAKKAKGLFTGVQVKYYRVWVASGELFLYNKYMGYLWDYDEKELQKTEAGRIFILERMINYGPGKKKIKLSEVKKYWSKLEPNLFAVRRRLMELLIWGKYQSSQSNKKSFCMG